MHRVVAAASSELAEEAHCVYDAEFAHQRISGSLRYLRDRVKVCSHCGISETRPRREMGVIFKSGSSLGRRSSLSSAVTKKSAPAVDASATWSASIADNPACANESANRSEASDSVSRSRASVRIAVASSRLCASGVRLISNSRASDVSKEIVPCCTEARMAKTASVSTRILGWVWSSSGRCKQQVSK